MNFQNDSINQTLKLNDTEDLGEDDIISDSAYQIIVPLLIILAMIGFLLNSIILVSILTAKLLMRTRRHDKYLHIIISMVSVSCCIKEPLIGQLHFQVTADTLTSLFLAIQLLCGSYLPIVHEVGGVTLFRQWHNLLHCVHCSWV